MELEVERFPNGRYNFLRRHLSIFERNIFARRRDFFSIPAALDYAALLGAPHAKSSVSSTGKPPSIPGQLERRVAVTARVESKRKHLIPRKMYAAVKFQA